MQKTNQGGLLCKGSSKTVKVFAASNAQRCPVRLFVKYIGLLPQTKSCGKLYLRPRSKPTPAVWFCDQPYGKNKIGNTVKKLCEIAKIEGRFMNHSLRATSALRMYHKEIPEQVIKEITGHRSDCVRVYKKTSDDILKKASSTISGDFDQKEEKFEADSHGNIHDQDEKNDHSDRLKQSLSVCQMIKNVIKTRMEIRKRKSTLGMKKLA